jgi:hypothetical protein
MAAVLHHTDWLTGRVPDDVRAQIRRLVEVVGYLPYPQPLGIVTADAVLLAANRPFLDLLGATGDEQLDADWDDFMPGWSTWTGGAVTGAPARPRTLAFEERLLQRGGEQLLVRVVANPVFAPAPGGDPEPALAAWTLFVVGHRPRELGRVRRPRGEQARLRLVCEEGLSSSP